MNSEHQSAKFTKFNWTYFMTFMELVTTFWPNESLKYFFCLIKLVFSFSSELEEFSFLIFQAHFLFPYLTSLLLRFSSCEIETLSLPLMKHRRKHLGWGGHFRSGDLGSHSYTWHSNLGLLTPNLGLFLLYHTVFYRKIFVSQSAWAIPVKNYEKNYKAKWYTMTFLYTKF